MKFPSVIFYLFATNILFFSLANIARIELATVALHALDFGLVAIAGIWTLVTIYQKKPVHFTYTAELLLFIFICFVSLLWNSLSLSPNEISVAFLYLFRFILYMYIYFIVSGFTYAYKEKIRKLLFSAGLFIVAIGYLQYFFYSDLRNLFYLGWDEHMNRMFSSFFDPNFAGAFFVLYALFILGHMYERYKKNKTVPFFLSIILFATVTAVFLTYSRSALLMLFVSVGAFLILIKKMRWIFYALLFFLLGTGIVIATGKTDNTNLLRTASSFARVTSSLEALAVFERHPLFGVGFNAYKYAVEDLGLRGEKGKVPNHADFGTDNSFLFVLATTGAVGFIAYVVLWNKILQNNLQQIRKKQNMLSVVLVASCIGLFVNSFFINSLFYPFILFWLWTLLGLTENI